MWLSGGFWLQEGRDYNVSIRLLGKDLGGGDIWENPSARARAGGADCSPVVLLPSKPLPPLEAPLFPLTVTWAGVISPGNCCGVCQAVALHPLALLCEPQFCRRDVAALLLVWHAFPAGICEPRTRGVRPDPGDCRGRGCESWPRGVRPDPGGCRGRGCEPCTRGVRL